MAHLSAHLREKKPYVTNSSDKIYVETIVKVKAWEPYKVDGKVVVDIRRHDIFSAPPRTETRIAPPGPPPGGAVVGRAPIAGVPGGHGAGARAASPARSDGSTVGRAPSEMSFGSMPPSHIITYPVGKDGKALMVNAQNPDQVAWLPVNVSKDWTVSPGPDDEAIVASKSLGMLRFAT